MLNTTKGLSEFTLKGLRKVELEFRLYALAHCKHAKPLYKSANGYRSSINFFIELRL